MENNLKDLEKELLNIRSQMKQDFAGGAQRPINAFTLDINHDYVFRTGVKIADAGRADADQQPGPLPRAPSGPWGLPCQ